MAPDDIQVASPAGEPRRVRTAEAGDRPRSAGPRDGVRGGSRAAAERLEWKRRPPTGIRAPHGRAGEASARGDLTRAAASMDPSDPPVPPGTPPERPDPDQLPPIEEPPGPIPVPPDLPPPIVEPPPPIVAATSDRG